MPKIPTTKERNTTFLSGESLRPSSSTAPYWTTTDGETVKLYLGDVITSLRKLPTKSIQTVVTSPPYWGLRDYGTAEWEGGSTECLHIAPPRGGTKKSGLKAKRDPKTGYLADDRKSQPNLVQYQGICGKCGAKRIDSQIGSEATPELFVEKMVEVFREVYRVLRDDGVCWINLGDSYANVGGAGSPRMVELHGEEWLETATGVQPKHGSTSGKLKKCALPQGNIVGIPWRVALALQADGWILRQDIIYSKTNPMPESVCNRCTKSHEYIFLLTKKGSGYFYDAEAIKERGTRSEGDSVPIIGGNKYVTSDCGVGSQSGGQRVATQNRNRRSVWTVSSQAFPGLHYATFPEKLITPCILAGTSAHGRCEKCGAPWRRVESNTKEWEPACRHTESDVVPCIVLDPFIGSGTTCVVAARHGLHSIGIDLSQVYLDSNAIPRISGELLSRPSTSHLVPRKPSKKIELGKPVASSSTQKIQKLPLDGM